MRIEEGNRERSRQLDKIVLEKKLGGRRKVKGTRAETVLRRTAAHDDKELTKQKKTKEGRRRNTEKKTGKKRQEGGMKREDC